MAAPDRRPPPAGLLLPDGSVVVPPEQAGELLRVVVVGLDVLVRANGGHVSAPARRLLYALDAATRHAGRRPPETSATGSGEQQSAMVGLSTAQAAALLGCSPRWVRALLVGGHLAGHRVGSRAWAVDATSLDRYRFTGGRDEQYEDNRAPAASGAR